MVLAMWDEHGRLRMDLSKPDVDAWLEQQQRQVDKIVAQRRQLRSMAIERKARWDDLQWRRWHR